MPTYFDTLWDMHRIAAADEVYDLIAIDRVLLHERTGGVALKSLAEKGFSVKDPSRVFAIMDHIVSFREGRGRDEARSPGGETFITETRRMANDAGIHLIDTDNPAQGIVHVAAPEQGIALPGLSLVCPDSHTCSLGALGALAWGIGSSDAEHAVATGCLRVKKPKQMLVRVENQLAEGVTAKDLALHLIATYGAAGGKRCAVEFAGPAIQAMSVEERLTLCNMAAEFGAFTAIIAPDEAIITYVRGRPFSPESNEAFLHWSKLATSESSGHDETITIDARTVRPQITWGTSPEEALPLGMTVPATAKKAADHWYTNQ